MPELRDEITAVLAKIGMSYDRFKTLLETVECGIAAEDAEASIEAQLKAERVKLRIATMPLNYVKESVKASEAEKAAAALAAEKLTTISRQRSAALAVELQTIDARLLCLRLASDELRAAIQVIESAGLLDAAPKPAAA